MNFLNQLTIPHKDLTPFADDVQEHLESFQFYHQLDQLYLHPQLVPSNELPHSLSDRRWLKHNVNFSYTLEQILQCD